MGCNINVMGYPFHCFLPKFSPLYRSTRSLLACWEPQADRVFQADLWSWRVCSLCDDNNDDDDDDDGDDGGSKTTPRYQLRKKHHQ